MSSCAKTTKARALGPASRNYGARTLQLLKPVRLERVLHSKRSRCKERPRHRR